MGESLIGIQHTGLAVLPRQESRLRTVRRRAVTVPAYLLGFVAFLLVSPLLLLIGVLIYLPFRRRLVSTGFLPLVYGLPLCGSRRTGARGGG